MKIHLWRNTRETWCGRAVTPTGGMRGTVAHRFTTYKHESATCLTCIKADEAEQRKEDAAS
jgi:hypothetical protein